MNMENIGIILMCIGVLVCIVGAIIGVVVYSFSWIQILPHIYVASLIIGSLLFMKFGQKYGKLDVHK